MRAAGLAAVLLLARTAGAAPPDRLVLMVFDQMRPEYIERFNLASFKRLRSRGTSFPNAYVGHLASVTVVSHAVISTGSMPPFRLRVRTRRSARP